MKKVLIFTGGRADFGILKPLIKKIDKSKKFRLILAAGSHHYSKKLGFTYREVLGEKLKINYSTQGQIKSTSSINTIDYCGKSMISYSKILEKAKPDLIFLLGDRYEVFSFCVAAFLMNIPIAHLHGGELTQGAFDDALRHSITKMSNFHFVCHDEYKNRVIQLGENPKTVFNYGSLSLENINRKKFTSKKQLLRQYKIPLESKIILATFHPETKSNISFENQINFFLSSLNKIKKSFIVFTCNNLDPSGDYFLNKIKEFNKKYSNSIIFKSMGIQLYHNFVTISDIVVGNSSSGIIEVPFLNTPTLNIGDRQKGRYFSSSIFQCELNSKKIIKSINSILFKKKKIIFEKQFYKKDTSAKILEKITELLKHHPNKKVFYNV